MAARSPKKKTQPPTAAEPAPEARVESQLAVVPGMIAEFSPTEAGLAELRSRMQGRVFDVTTTAGMKEAKEARRELVTLRTSLEAKRKDVKEDALLLCKRIDGEAARIRKAIEELEDPIDAQIKAREKAIDDAREERIAAERREAARIQKVLDDTRNTPVLMTGKSADLICAAIEELEGKTFEDLPEHSREEAIAIRDAAVARLVTMKDERIRLDAERAELDAERERQKTAEQRAGYEREIAAIKSLPSDVYDSPVEDIESVFHSLAARKFNAWPQDLEAQAIAAANVTRDRLQSRINEKRAAADRERNERAYAAKLQTARDLIEDVVREPGRALVDDTSAAVWHRIERLNAQTMPSAHPDLDAKFESAKAEALHALRLRHSDLIRSEQKADQEARDRAATAERQALREIEQTSLLDAAKLGLATLRLIRSSTLVDVGADPTVIPKLASAIDRAEKGAALARDATEANAARMRAPRKTAKTANASRKKK